MVDPILQLHAISVLEEISTSGHSPLKVICDDYNVYFVKNNKGIKPSIYLTNEIICHYLAMCWDIKTPDIALVDVDSDLIPDGFSNKHKSHYYVDLAFGSKQVENATELSMLNDEIKTKHDYNRFSDPLDYLKIGLFDIWVDNDDRRPSNYNLLLNSSMNFVAFDHAFTFCSMNYSDLIPEISNTFNASIFNSNLAKGIIKYLSRTIDLNKILKNYFYLCIDTCKQNFEDACTKVPKSYGLSNDLKSSLLDFLFDKKRNDKVLTEFYSRL